MSGNSTSVGEAKERIGNASDSADEAKTALASATEAVHEALAAINSAAGDSDHERIKDSITAYQEVATAWEEAAKLLVKAQDDANEYSESLG
jgi:hypothetical protein